jgi:hypothetical protein
MAVVLPSGLELFVGRGFSSFQEDGVGSSLGQRMRKEKLLMATSEKQERKGKFPSDCDKMFFNGSNYNRASTTVLQHARAYILAYHKI